MDPESERMGLYREEWTLKVKEWALAANNGP